MPSPEQSHNQTPQIIDHVPGVERAPEDQALIVHGQVVRIPAEEFKGDPSKVLGHPSNPYANMDTSGLFPSTVQESAKPADSDVPVEVSQKPADPTESKN
jgi:hypothetical protein